MQLVDPRLTRLPDEDNGMVRASQGPGRRSLLVAAIAVSLLAGGWLWTQFGYLRTHGGICMLAPASGRLEARGFATYIVGRGGLGQVIDVAVAWPPGYSAVPTGSGELSVRDASGREVARTGAEMSLTGGFSGGEFQACEARFAE